MSQRPKASPPHKPQAQTSIFTSNSFSDDALEPVRSHHKVRRNRLLFTPFMPQNQNRSLGSVRPRRGIYPFARHPGYNIATLPQGRPAQSVVQAQETKAEHWVAECLPFSAVVDGCGLARGEQSFFDNAGGGRGGRKAKQVLESV